MKKLCEITDVIPVRVFPNQSKKMGPIKPMLMDNTLIFSILNGYPSPKHFYAVDPNNRNRKVLLTRENYNKSTEELFSIDSYSKDESSIKTATLSEPIIGVTVKHNENVTAETEVNNNEEEPINYSVEISDEKVSDDVMVETSEDQPMDLNMEADNGETSNPVVDKTEDTVNLDIEVDSTADETNVESSNDEQETENRSNNYRPNYQNNKKKNNKKYK